MTERKKLVLVGNGMAGVRSIEHLLKLAPDAYDITIIGSEPHPNYNRIMLSHVLAGTAGIDDIVINDWNWYKENNINLITGQTVTKVDVEQRKVITDAGVEVGYDNVILAMGSNPFMPPIPGSDKEGVIAFRNIEDCETMFAAAKSYKKAAVIGGGLLGLEAARGLLDLGMDVTVIHRNPILMNAQLDEPAGRMLQRELEAQGMKFMLSAQTTKMVGGDRVEGLEFKDGSELQTDLVVMAVGIRPNVKLAQDSGIEANQGVVVDDFMQTSAPGVYAVGECIEHRGVSYGLVAPLYDQGAVLAKRLAGVETAGYTGSITSTKLKVSGVDVFSAGVFLEKPGMKALRIQDDLGGTYKKIVIENGKLIGAVLFGDISDGTELFSYIKKGESIEGREKELLLGVSADALGGKGSSTSKFESMPDDEIVCGCNGVTKAMITDAIKNKGCNTLSAIKGCTKAAGSCGGCKSDVEGLLKVYAGDALGEPVKEGICGCTTLSRDEIVAEVSRMGLKTVKEVMNVLEWKEPEGCSKCRPALNYYLGMLFPEEYVDEKESKITNERFHANIQKDGTFSVVPRIYGGVTSPSDLKKIAEVAEKFEVPLVKFTGGQRIDLLGVKKEDLPKMWEELDMPSGHAYGKTLRTVKTCVGNTFCRFGTQDAMGMGIKLEKAFERMTAPAKVKLAVSGCPRNCAEATIKDLGLVAIDGGWELHVGGNGGVHVRATDLLCVVKTEEEVMEWSYAYLQYYRENGNWNERTSTWVERVGLDSIKAALEKQEDRLALKQRLETAIGVTVDPWKEIIEKDDLRKNFEQLSGAQPVRG
ncbi:nitrite reductase large subunit NirB [Paenibacillus sp. NEAU-GSW1]|uniref:nitrite reductase large subunit NirB n=1 Tax=Paenibacillus sp. NEAU-GSW1 TaxID=2682486 RepID=UPI0012E2E081|nr:nitrite reductase large subunit NirB [Paenibacillus sp. NEAU-GSW1]MUT66578.1 nitrite reductase large subunit [Paenibacillus sp. NEAU-GSW1]